MNNDQIVIHLWPMGAYNCGYGRFE
ncbi:hypothetical protein PUN4_30014 [Paraburkholderia unamae]|nr:hypothetical protein PUN4_30014 [Paraburkholderia unamae]